MPVKKIIQSVLILLLITTAFLATPGRVSAATIVVNVLDEQNDTGSTCSLRDAIIAANTNRAYGGCPGGSGTDDVISLPAGDIKLRKAGTDDTGYLGDLDILEGVTISGVGPSTRVIAYFPTGSSDRIFHVKSSTKVTLKNMTLTLGDASNLSFPGGGAILNDSNSVLSLSWLTITRNAAGTNGSGGGIMNKSTAKLTINTSTISVNTAYSGGGIYNEGSLTITNSVINSNTGYSSGGGLDNNTQQATENATLINTTVAKNFSQTNGGGAGISNSGSSNLYLVYDTIVDNDPEGLVFKNGSKVSFQNTIVALHGPQNCIFEGSVTVTDQDYNLEDNNTCGFNKSHDKINTNPKFVEASPGQVQGLWNNGGPTQTYALQDSSPAVDAVPTNAASCTGTDQRLYGRGSDGNDDSIAGCDIGAYEVDGILLSMFLPNIAR